MRILIIFFSIVCAAELTFAETNDPFDPLACTGSTMSVETALELLGSNQSVNLGKTSVMRIRQRNIIDGVNGAWFLLENYYDVEPYLRNADTKLQFVFLVDTNNLRRNSYQCSKQNSGSFDCKTSDEYVSLGQFQITLTDHCVRLVSSKMEYGRETQFAYLLRF